MTFNFVFIYQVGCWAFIGGLIIFLISFDTFDVFRHFWTSFDILNIFLYLLIFLDIFWISFDILDIF